MRLDLEGPERWDITLEFPEIIPAVGRQRLHKIGDYFGLAHHSTGKKARRTYLYSKLLYQDKQRTELNKLVKNREKLREKYQNLELNRFDKPDNADEFVKNVLLEMWYEKFEPDKNKGTWYMPEANSIGKVPNVEDLKKLISLKKKSLEHSYHEMPLLQQRAESEIKKMN